MFLSINALQISNPNPKPSQTPCTSLISPIHFHSSLHFTKNPSKTQIRCSVPDQQTLPQSAIQRIADKLQSLGIIENNIPTAPIPNPEASKIGEIFIPYPNQLPKHRVGHTLDPSWSTPENPVPRPGSGKEIVRLNELTRRAKRERKEEKVPSLAELSLSQAELRRLRGIGMAERRKLKVGKAGITEGIVNGIHERWRRAEVVKIVCEDLCRQNMKRTHDLLERKTGGLVVWRSGSKIILHRGTDYKYPYFLTDENSDAAESIPPDDEGTNKTETSTSNMKDAQYPSPRPTNRNGQPTLVQGVGAQNRVRFQLPGEAQLSEEADHLLDGLGPRFTDWWGYDPFPVDADLLPAVVPGYRRPFRLLPYGIKAKLTDDEMTTLRRLGRPLPCHFALGRNRKLQGLAASIVKLWEKCEIAKIAVKRGVQNTNTEIMTEELKWLTGGTVLSRDREFIVLYRGKDFLPSAVSSAIEERRNNVTHRVKYQDHGMVGEFSEDIQDRTISRNLTNEADHNTSTRQSDPPEQRKISSTEAAIKQTNLKLSRALEKKAQAEKLLADLEKNEMPENPDVDKEGITEEERYMLRKIGLKMRPFLLMGRRGVFAGTVENMHLHWKYRELVKIICNETRFDAVHQEAQILEAESGGILVAVERVSKGYAIIVYRGKNYTRPACLRPATLMTKREAMKRSLEEQRRKSLKLHVLKLTKNIDELKLQLERDKESQNLQSLDETRSQVIEDVTNITDVANSRVSATPVKLESMPESNSLSSPVTAQNFKENLEARNNDIANLSSVGLSDDPDASLEDAQPAQKLGERSLFPLGSGDGLVKNETVTSTMESVNVELKESSSTLVKEDKKVYSRLVYLSNRERLLLRKQALKMKKRPVLAVGRSNIVTGVAKAIKTHFKKHPLAIVNVKGRAKGTSVQELAFKLEQATGAVLVSQEPNKVILYRGWGADGELWHMDGKNVQDGKTIGDSVTQTKSVVSPELIAAIKLECGLQQKQAENPVSSAS